MRDKSLSFDVVLKEAQRLGYAEADPTFDVEGVDAAHKLSIMSAIAFGNSMSFEKAHVEGISALDAADIKYAEQLGYRIKLLGITKRTSEGVELRVHPTLIPTRRLIANVEGAMNAVLVKADAVGATLYYGKGAGALLRQGCRRRANGFGGDRRPGRRDADAYRRPRAPRAASGVPARCDGRPGDSDVITSYYLRLRVEDRPGVLADVTRILADHDISIDAMIQREPGEGEQQTDIIMLTHQTRERNIDAAIVRIEGLAAVAGKIIRLRLEQLL